MKLIRRILLVVVLLVVVGLAVVYFSLNHIIRSTVESQATSSLNLTTTLGGADLSLFGGKLSLSDLQVGSPQGFSAPQMLSLGQGTVAVSYGQLTKDPVRISSIIIDKPNLVIERSGGKMNISVLGGSSSPSPDNSASSASGKPPMKLIIDDLQLNDAMVTVRPGIPGLKDEYQVPIPSLELKNIGNDDSAGNGAAVKDVITQVITALAAKASDSGGLPAEFNTLLKGNLSDLSKNLGANFNQQLGNISKSLKLPGNLSGTINDLTNSGGKSVKPDQLLNGFLSPKKASTQP